MSGEHHRERLPFLAGNSLMIERVRAFDWAANPLGEPETWPPELIAAASFVLESHFPAALVWGPELVTIHNDAFAPILGNKPPALGRSFADVWSEAWDSIAPIVARAYAGEATYVEEMPLAIDRYGYLEQANFTFCYSPVRAGDGRVVGLIDTVMETTATVQARARAAFINNELGHRLKNTMSMVQAMATQSLKGVADRALVDAFTDRVVALGRAHDILLQTSWEQASLADVVAKALAVHGGEDRVTVAGEDLALGARAVLSLSMILHELATNAAKYGALSAPGGRVRLGWRIEGDREASELVVDWQESGGPAASAPERLGFGSRLIDLGLAGTGGVKKRYLPSGLEVELRAPLFPLLQA